MVIYSVILFAAAAVFLLLGVLLYRGNTNLIHDYHQTKIKESDKAEYGKAFAKAMFGIAVTMAASGAVALFGAMTAALAILFAGLTGSIVVIAGIQKKYNGGIF